MSRELSIFADEVELPADLLQSDRAQALVIFAHGSGSGRQSPRNRRVARLLQPRFATLLVDLLSPEEAELDGRTGELRFDIDLLTDRLVQVTDFASSQIRLPIAYYGSSTGAAAALVAASRRPDNVFAVVSRGGRPDLAGDALERVFAPTLFIVGGEDHAVLRLNDRARPRLGGQSALVIVPRAGHLFEEPGALDEVAELALDWLGRTLAARPEARPRP